MAIATRKVGIRMEQTAVQSMSRQRRILVVLFVVSFALDFKGAAGGSPIQFLMAGLNIVTFLLLTVSYRFAVPCRGFGAFAFWSWAIFLLTGTIGALINTVYFGHFIRTIYPFVLFLEGFLVAWWVSRDGRSATTLIAAMIFAALVSLIFTFFWGFYFTGEGVRTIRYQILSPLIPFLIIVSGYDLFFTRQRRLRSLTILMLTVGMIGLSVPRGMLLVVGMATIIVFLAWLWNALRSTVSLPRPILRGLLWGSMVGAGGVLTALIFAPEIIQRWIHRGLGAAHDATFWTRVAAVVGQWEQLSSHQISWVFGQGFGHSYRYAGMFAQSVYPYISTTAFNAPKWFPGEFMWVTPLYYGGFVAGALAIVVLLWAVARVFRLLALSLRERTWGELLARPVWLGSLGCIAFLGMGFTANPFILRLSALFLGLCVGLVATPLGILRTEERYSQDPECIYNSKR